MTTPHDELRMSLGAYALGTLEPGEQGLVEHHLASCPACLAELDELVTVVPALASLTPAEAMPPEPSPDLFHRVNEALRTDAANAQTAVTTHTATVHRFRSRRWLTAAAAAVIVLSGAGAAIGVVATSSSTPATTTASATSGAVQMSVAATDLSAGTRLAIKVGGLPEGEHCTLVATAADGTRHDAGSWTVDYAVGPKYTEKTDVPRAQLRQLTLYGSQGQKLVNVQL